MAPSIRSTRARASRPSAPTASIRWRSTPTGRVYIAWSERGHATLRPDPITGDARIVVSTSVAGTTWSVPAAIRTDGLGHEVMPALSFQAGRLRMVYYDLREDVSQIFGQFVDEAHIWSA